MSPKRVFLTGQIACWLLLLVGTAAVSGIVASRIPSPLNAASAESRLQQDWEAGTSSLLVSNLGAVDNADIRVELWPFEGGEPTVVTRTSVAPGAQATVDLETLIGLPFGVYSARLYSSSGPLGAIGLTDWTGENDSMVSHMVRRVGRELYLPFFRNKSGGTQDTFILLQNLDPSGEDLEVEVFLRNSPSGFQSVQTVTVPAWESKVVDMLPASFDEAWARLVATGDIAAEAVRVDSEAPGSAASFEAVPSEDLASALAVPALYRRVGPSQRSSTLYISNPRNEDQVMRITYRGLAGSCAGGVYTLGPTGIAARTTQSYETVFSEGQTDCIANAFVEASGGLMVLADIWNGYGNAMYSADLPSRAAPELVLPVLRKRLGVTHQLTSEIFVQNPGSQTAVVSLQLFDDAGTELGCGPACQVQLPPLGGRRWDLRDLPVFPDASVGSGRIQSDRPVLGMVYEASVSGSIDAMIHKAQPIDGHSLRSGAMPILLRRPAFAPPTDTATAVGTPSETPASSPTPSATTTASPTPLPSATPTAPAWASLTPAPTEFPGQIFPTLPSEPYPRPGTPSSVSIFARGIVDVFGGDDPDCSGCDGNYDTEDIQAASESPLGELRFLLRDAQGRAVMTRTSNTQGNLIELAILRAPALAPGEHYTLELLDMPSSMELCPSTSLSRTLGAGRFPLGSSPSVDFRFWNGCAAPTATPTAVISPTLTPTITLTSALTPTPSLGGTSTPTSTLAISPTATSAVTATATMTATIMPSITPTDGSTPTVAATVTPTASATATPLPSPSMTPEPTATPMPTATPTATARPTPSRFWNYLPRLQQRRVTSRLVLRSTMVDLAARISPDSPRIWAFPQ